MALLIYAEGGSQALGDRLGRPAARVNVRLELRRLSRERLGFLLALLRGTLDRRLGSLAVGLTQGKARACLGVRLPAKRKKRQRS